MTSVELALLSLRDLHVIRARGVAAGRFEGLVHVGLASSKPAPEGGATYRLTLEGKKFLSRMRRA